MAAHFPSVNTPPNLQASEDERRTRAVAGVAALLEVQPVPLERAVRPWFGPSREARGGRPRPRRLHAARRGQETRGLQRAGRELCPALGPGRKTGSVRARGQLEWHLAGACGPRRAAAAPAGRAGSSPAGGGPGRHPPRPAAASGPQPSARSAPLPGPSGPPSRPAGWGSAGRGPVQKGRGPVSSQAGGPWVPALPSVLTRGPRAGELICWRPAPPRFYLNWGPSTERKEAPLCRVRGRDGRGGAGRAGRPPPPPHPAPLIPRPRPRRTPGRSRTCAAGARSAASSGTASSGASGPSWRGHGVSAPGRDLGVCLHHWPGGLCLPGAVSRLPVSRGLWGAPSPRAQTWSEAQGEAGVHPVHLPFSGGCGGPTGRPAVGDLPSDRPSAGDRGTSRGSTGPPRPPRDHRPGVQPSTPQSPRLSPTEVVQGQLGTRGLGWQGLGRGRGCRLPEPLSLLFLPFLLQLPLQDPLLLRGQLHL